MDGARTAIDEVAAPTPRRRDAAAGEEKNGVRQLFPSSLLSFFLSFYLFFLVFVAHCRRVVEAVDHGEVAPPTSNEERERERERERNKRRRFEAPRRRPAGAMNKTATAIHFLCRSLFFFFVLLFFGELLAIPFILFFLFWRPFFSLSLSLIHLFFFHLWMFSGACKAKRWQFFFFCKNIESSLPGFRCCVLFFSLATWFLKTWF